MKHTICSKKYKYFSISNYVKEHFIFILINRIPLLVLKDACVLYDYKKIKKQFARGC